MVSAVLYSTLFKLRSAARPKARAFPILTRSRNANRYRTHRNGMTRKSIRVTSFSSVVWAGHTMSSSCWTRVPSPACGGV